MPDAPPTTAQPERQHLVKSAGDWFGKSRHHQTVGGPPGFALAAMENAYNHVENALAAERATIASLRAQATLDSQALTSLREKLERAQKDTARLDWLEAHPFMAYRDRDPESGHLDDHFTLVDENKGRRDGRRGIVKATLREAIDEAKGAA